MKRVFVLNPHAGGGALDRQLRGLETYFLDRTGSFEALLCDSREDTIRKTSAALAAGATQIVAVGGDGTMNAVANGFFHAGDPTRSDATLAVGCIGTGSDYYRMICGQGLVDWRDVVLSGNSRRVDVAVIRRLDDAQARPVYFLNLAGFGLSAQVVARKERMPRWLPRSLCYVLPTLASYFSVRPWQTHIEIDCQQFQREVLSVVVGKGIYAGGGMRFGGAVELDDGLLEITVFQPMSLLALLAKTPRLYRGDFAGENKITKHKAQRVVLRARPSLPAECDGELIGSGDFEVTLIPRALPVCTPV
jgi:YegS/Rv2252/BmrU family lipid kinase